MPRASATCNSWTSLYGFFHANAKRLGQHARVGGTRHRAEHCQDLAQAIAQRALEGLVRSLAKELRRAITVQLLYGSAR